MDLPEAFDAIVIGSGFGGAVAACRLAQAGFRICVLERGRRYTEDDFPAVDADDGLIPDLTHLTWAGDGGIWDLRRAGGVDVGQASGYGGGSLIYANVHLRPPDDVFASGWPAGYSRPALDPYYDLVAHALEVQCSLRVGPDPCAKADCFASAAGRLGRSGDVFAAPVAIRGAGECTGCAACDFGCRRRAKSTLDVTYLATAERQTGVDGERLADVRTSCEALLLRASEAPERPRFAVDYVDHLCGGARRTVTAPRVFVCAGTLNTLELLLRSRRVLPGIADSVGQRVFTNCDQLGVVFDAREAHQPTRGPVITTGLVHREGDGTRVLLQEGGFPYGLRSLYAAFRARALLARNRHLDVPAASDAHRHRSDRASVGTSAVAREAERDSPRAFDRASRVAASLAAGDYRDAVPEQIATVFRSLRGSLESMAADQIGAVARGTLIQLIEQRVARAVVVASRVPGLARRPAAAAAVARTLVQGLAGLLRRLLGLNDEAILRAAVASVAGQLGLDEPLAATARFVAQALSLDPAIDDPETYVAHGAVLLSMARDPEPSRANLDATGRLVVDVPASTRQRCASAERLMRDFAAEYGGELRMLPGWSFSRRPLSVHLHGGCGMGDSPAGSVTDPFGEVRGCPGLFVLDGAALPAPVGVNPSSTIAAVAERNIEHHIRRWRGDPAWRAPGWQDARRFAARHAEDLDPAPLRRTAASAPLRAEPLGLVFRERMTGFAAEIEEMRGAAIGYERAEEAGRRAGRAISLDLEYRVPDLDRFVDGDPVFSLSGTFTGSVDSSGKVGVFPVAGTLTLSRRTPRERAWFWTYNLAFRTESAHATLVGRKVLSTGARDGLWSGAITMLGDISVGSRTMTGILRVSMEDILGGLLPSLRVTGTRDPARIAWALGQFAAHLGKEIWELRGAGAMFDPVLHPIAAAQPSIAAMASATPRTATHGSMVAPRVA
jgi:choline dehydrogenase-like flavoprotein